MSKYSSEMYEERTRSSVNFLGNETEITALVCTVCKQHVDKRLNKSAKDIEHAVSEIDCLRKFQAEDDPNTAILSLPLQTCNAGCNGMKTSHNQGVCIDCHGNTHVIRNY